MDRMSWLTRGADGLGRTFAQVPVTPAAAQPRAFAMPKMRDRFAAPGISPVSGTTFRDPGFDVGDRFAPDVPAYDYRSAFKPSFGVQRDFLFGTRSQQAADQNFGGGWETGTVSNMGGEWATLDGMNSYIQNAAQQTGVPANLIKAMLAREGSFGKDKYVTDVGRRKPDGTPDNIYAFNGIYESTAESYGIDFNRMVQDDAYAVWAMGRVLQGVKENNPFLQSWDDAAAYYFAGPNWDNPTWRDEVGNTVDSYKYHPQGGVITRWKMLDQAAGDMPTYRWTDTPLGNNRAVQEAMRYVGSAYVWGGIPGKGDPGGNWDCSGMVYWMDQNYGSGEIPMGSHYQYQWAQNTGRLTMDVNSLQPGDLLFFDTGNYAGAGANLNNAGHVGVYIGNGQMLHAANPTDGTIVSDLNAYMQMYGFLGGARTSFSGGGGGFGGSSYDPSNWRDALRMRGF